MQNKTKNNIFLNVDDILKYDCIVNMIYGARGIGKTYGFLEHALEHYEKTGKGTIYLRRYKDELREFETILNPIFENRDFKIDIQFKKNKEFIDTKKNKIILKGMPLSKAPITKSSNFNNFDIIIFDEFIIDKSNYQYIPNEFIAFHNFIETVARMREITNNTIIKTYMLANSASRNNPYFIGYNIPITKKNPYIKDDLLLYKPSIKSFIDEKLKTRWGQFIKNNTKMVDYMLYGDFNDKNDFIDKKLPAQNRYICTLIYLQQKIGIYSDTKNNIIYISDKINPTNKNIYSLTKQDDTPDIISINSNKKILDTLKKYYNLGMVRFTDLKIQTIFIDILKIL